MQIVALSWRDLANPSSGGAEVVLDHILDGLRGRGFDVALVCGGPTAERTYPVVQAGGTYSQYLLAPLACIVRFRGADLVIDVENGIPYFAPLWRRRPTLCLVHHVHTDQWETRFPRAIARLLRFIETRVMPRVYRHQLFVAISQSTSAALQAIGVASERIMVIEAGTDAAPDHARPKSESPTFVCLSRLVPHKRVELVLEAWRLASDRIPGRLVVAGSGPALTSIRRTAQSIPRVEVRGHVSEQEKYQLLGQSWALVCASHHEGWGMTVLEAASVGTPCLAVDVPGIRDAVINGVTGVLVPDGPEGVAAALARAWVDLASDAEALRVMGAAARERADGMDWETVIDRWVSVIADVAATSQRRSGGRRMRVDLHDHASSQADGGR